MYKKLIAGLIITMSPFVSGMTVLNKDIARHHIQSWLTFQEVSRLKQVSKYCNELYDIASNCPYMHGNVCPTYACNRCAKSYYHCTKMLVDCALKGNEQMFKHLWVHHRNIRKSNVAKLMKKSKEKLASKIKGEKLCHQKFEITMEDAMHCYGRYYSKLKNIHRHIFNCVMKAIRKGDIVLANTMLSGSGLSLFDLCKDEITLDCLFVQACELNDVDLIKNICGGYVDECSFGYVIRYAHEQLLFDLIDKDILPAESVTKDEKKSVLHFVAQRGFDNVIKIALEKGAWVNCRDFYEKTPLHYAVKNANLGVVTELLKSVDADVRFKDIKGRMPIEYNTPQREYLLHVPKMTFERNVIAIMLKEHKDQHQVAAYSYSKVHSNGYQMLHI
jgi:hypothetical protein